jgi:hypothetical protein
MRRQWTFMLTVPIVIALTLWGLGIIGGHNPSRRSAALPRRSPSPAASAGASGSGLTSGRPEFAASFAGSSLDRSVWGTCYPAMDRPTGCTNFGNPEYQWYLPGQVKVSGGDLSLVARQVPTAGLSKSGARKEYDCRSGMVTTYSSFHFEYGYMQVAADIPNAPGLWPGLWLAAEDNVWPPEIDMIEQWGATAGHPASTGAYFHPAPFGTPQVRAVLPGGLAPGWHTFGLLWTKTELKWFVDGTTVLTVRSQIPHQQMYFIADLAEFAKPVASDYCNGSLDISSVKVWKTN